MQPFRGVTRITEDNIEDLIPPRGQLLLIACLKQGDDKDLAIDALSQTARWFSRDVSVCFAGDDIVGYLMDRFHFSATPTYLLLRHGNVLATRSGRAKAEDLIGFVRCVSACGQASREA